MLETLELNPADAPRATLIILHGLGADGSDFLQLCRALDLSAVGPVRYVMPNAPARPVTINNGHVMPAWYDIIATPGGVRIEDEPGLRTSQAQIAALIDREVARGVPAERIVLMGFSQGCAMTLLTGLRYPARLAGLAALSGYLPLPDTTEAERHAANLSTPIFLAHGDDDDVVVPARGAAARDRLRALGHTVDWHTYPMGHSLCMEEVEDLNAWLLKTLA